MTLRTDDISYGKHYWQSLDDGAGYNDSTLHEDLSYLVKETFGIDRRTPDKWNTQTRMPKSIFGYLI
jgi:hypothetical protein